MKKYILLIMIIILMALTGCSKNKTEETVKMGNDELTETVSDPSNQNNEKDDEEKSEYDGDVFSDRDLDSNPDLSDAVSIIAKNDEVFTINEAGIYVLSGVASNYTVKVEAEKEAKVQLVLKDVEITNDNFPVIYVKSADKCFVTSFGNNTISVNNGFMSDGDINTDAVIFSKDDLTLNGKGTLSITSVRGNGITCKDDLKITDGTYVINAYLDAIEANDSVSVYDGNFTIETNKDGFHCENDDKEGSVYINNGTYNIKAKDDGIQATTVLEIDGGTYNIEAAEGMEATYVKINEGNISIYATDDGINAAKKCDTYDVLIEINGGYIKVSMGAGDTDCLDANGSIIMNGGTVDLTGQSTFDYDVNAAYNGGTIIINGQEVDSIPSAMMGGRGGNKENFNTEMPEGNFNREEFKGGFNKDEQRQKPERQ